jgi:hypothetical protein
VDKSNWDKLNAMHAKDAQLDNHSLTEDAKHQDQYANAIKNTTKLPTLVLTAMPVNFQETVPTDNKT